MGISNLHTYAPYEVAAMPNIPGSGNILTIPFDLLSNIQSIKGAIACKDKESLTYASISTAGLPFNAVNSIEQNLQLGAEMRILPSYRMITFAKVSGALGIVLCLIEIVIEGLQIFKQHKFLKKFESKPSLEKKMRWLSKKYLEVDESKKAAKFLKLTRLLRPFAAEQIKTELPVLLKRYYDSKSIWGTYDGNIWAKKIVTLIHTQSDKKIKLQCIGIAALVLSIIGLAITIIGMNPLIPTLFIGGSMILGIVRYALHKGCYDNEGWTFTPKNLLPLWARNILHLNPSS